MAKSRKARVSRQPRRGTPAKVYSTEIGPVRFAISAQVRLNDAWVNVPDDMAAVMASPAAWSPPDEAQPADHRLIAAMVAGTPPDVAASMSVQSEALNTRLSRVADFLIPQLRRMALDVATSMDPRLQLALVNSRMGKQGLPLSSAGGDSLPVVARVTSFAEWCDVPDVDAGVELGPAANGDGVVVTGRIPVARSEAVRQNPTVLSLKASQPVHPTLANTPRSMDVQTGNPRIAGSLGGAGVVIGVVDSGGDFAHRNFLHADGSTRLLCLWQQGASARANSPFGYGRLFSRDEINSALATPNPYGALGYDPGTGSADSLGAHGTHVMDIAAGNGRGSGLPGIAPEADLIFVEMSARDIAWSGQKAVFNSFGDSVQMLEAVKFIFDQAGDRPCVVNLSLGTNGGPHDGTSLVEQGFDALLLAKPNRAIVLAAGNAQGDNVHTMGTVPPDAPLDVPWRTLNKQGGEFELWYPGSKRLRFELLTDTGDVITSVGPGENFPLEANGEVAAFLSSRLADPNNKDNVIGIWLAPNWPSGQVRVRLSSLTDEPVEFHAWIERQIAQGSFLAPVTSHLLGSLSTGKHTVVVGAYDARKTSEPASTFSSSGPTRDGRQKPDVSAPGSGVSAAMSRSVDGNIKKSGTSMAAPAVTGLIALMLAKARSNGVELTIHDIHAKLQAGVKPPGVGAAGWDPQLGAGRANGAAV